MYKETTYFGWSNRETWLASLWLSNTLEFYEMMIGVVADDCCIQLQANRLKARLIEQVDELGIDAGFWRDLRRCDLDRVNWQEVVEAHSQ